MHVEDLRQGLNADTGRIDFFEMASNKPVNKPPNFYRKILFVCACPVEFCAADPSLTGFNRVNLCGSVANIISHKGRSIW